MCAHLCACVCVCVRVCRVYILCTQIQYVCTFMCPSVCLSVHTFLCVVLKCELVKVVSGNISTKLHVHISISGQPMLLLPSMLLVMWCGGSIS